MKVDRESDDRITEPLQWEDWDFSDVPNEELIACCYWEYARESTFIRETLQHYREYFHRGFIKDPKKSDAIFDRMDRIQSIGDISDVIIRGCAFPADMVWQSADQNAKDYRHPDADPITGSFPAPWQRLPQPERTSRSRMTNHGTGSVPVPFERAHWSEARDIAQHCRTKVDAINAAYHRVQEENPGKSEVQLIEEGKLQPGPDPTASLFWESGREVTVVRISWEDYTNDQLVQYFRRWVKASRPERLPVPSRQGHKPGDWRARLTRLAAMRLLANLKPSEISAARGKLASEVCESKQFSRCKWLDTIKWHDARREAGQIFCTLFPFLPPSEKPRSWLRKAPNK